MRPSRGIAEERSVVVSCLLARVLAPHCRVHGNIAVFRKFRCFPPECGTIPYGAPRLGHGAFGSPFSSRSRLQHVRRVGSAAYTRRPRGDSAHRLRGRGSGCALVFCPLVMRVARWLNILHDDNIRDPQSAVEPQPAKGLTCGLGLMPNRSINRYYGLTC